MASKNGRSHVIRNLLCNLEVLQRGHVFCPAHRLRAFLLTTSQVFALLDEEALEISFCETVLREKGCEGLRVLADDGERLSVVIVDEITCQ